MGRFPRSGFCSSSTCLQQSIKQTRKKCLLLISPLSFLSDDWILLVVVLRFSICILEYKPQPFQRASERSHSPVSASKRNTWKFRQPARQVKNVPFRPPGKTVVVLGNIALPHPEKGGPGNLLSVGSFKLLFQKQKSLKAANNKSPHKRKLIRRTVYQTFNTKQMVNNLV